LPNTLTDAVTPVSKAATPTQDKSLHHLGQTRSSVQADHALLTPDTFVRAPLPGMVRASAVVHTAPAMRAAFTQYTAEIEPGGSLGPTESQRFVFVLEGKAQFDAGGDKYVLAKGGYAYLPPGPPGSISPVSAPEATRLAVIEKDYQPLDRASSATPKVAAPQSRMPAVLVGKEPSIAPQPFLGDDALLVRTLLPDDPAFDFAVNTMTYQPGAILPMVESHVMEHGLLMLEGQGIYRLGDRWYPVVAGDFIWMAPYCLQWFGALGKVPAKYLIYKPWNRHPLG
jgi:(S)-ureidoglycine aminohydrolase